MYLQIIIYTVTTDNSILYSLPLAVSDFASSCFPPGRCLPITHSRCRLPIAVHRYPSPRPGGSAYLCFTHMPTLGIPGTGEGLHQHPLGWTPVPCGLWLQGSACKGALLQTPVRTWPATPEAIAEEAQPIQTRPCRVSVALSTCACAFVHFGCKYIHTHVHVGISLSPLHTCVRIPASYCAVILYCTVIHIFPYVCMDIHVHVKLCVIVLCGVSTNIPFLMDSQKSIWIPKL